MAELLAESLIRDIPDFPKPGILFKDITPILEHPSAFQQVIDELAERSKQFNPTHVVGIESRGFIFGAPLALKMGLPFVVVRKLGKLPYDKISEEYALEYGTNTVEMHTDSVKAGDRPLVVDDLLATGGTALATARMLERLGAEIAGFAFVVELTFLPGRHALRGYEYVALIEY